MARFEVIAYYELKIFNQELREKKPDNVMFYSAAKNENEKYSAILVWYDRGDKLRNILREENKEN